MSDSTIHVGDPGRRGLLFSLSSFFGLGASYSALCHKWSKIGVLGEHSDSQTQMTLVLMLFMLLSLTGLVGAILSMQRGTCCVEQHKKAMWGLALGFICAVPPLWVFCQSLH